LWDLPHFLTVSKIRPAGRITTLTYSLARASRLFHPQVTDTGEFLIIIIAVPSIPVRIRPVIAIAVRAPVPAAIIIIRMAIGLSSPVAVMMAVMMIAVIIRRRIIVSGQSNRCRPEQACQRQNSQEHTSELGAHKNSFLST